MDESAAFNELCVEYLPQRPARSAFAAAGLAFGAGLELECIALAGQR
jgi:2-iminobutanoate/2-iminopropanoate deaminase